MEKDYTGATLLAYHTKYKDFYKARVIAHDTEKNLMQVLWVHEKTTSVLDPEESAFEVLKKPPRIFRRNAARSKRRKQEQFKNTHTESKPVSKRQADAFDELDKLEKQMNWIPDDQLPNLDCDGVIKYIKQRVPSQIGFPYKKLRKLRMDGKKLIRANDFFLKKLGLKSKGARTTLLHKLKSAKKKYKKQWKEILEAKPEVKQIPKRSRWDLPFDPKQVPELKELYTPIDASETKTPPLVNKI